MRISPSGGVLLQGLDYWEAGLFRSSQESRVGREGEWTAHRRREDSDLLKRKRENQAQQKIMMENDDPIRARLNESSPKSGREFVVTNNGDGYDPQIADTFA